MQVCRCHPGPMWDPAEVEAARERVRIKRALRVWLREHGYAVIVR